MFDDILATDDVMASRRCDFRLPAAAYILDEDGAIVFAFFTHESKTAGHLAGLHPNGMLWANESFTSMIPKGFVRLPPNNPLDRTRAR
jgi:hypothetical protein